MEKCQGVVDRASLPGDVLLGCEDFGVCAGVGEDVGIQASWAARLELVCGMEFGVWG